MSTPLTSDQAIARLREHPDAYRTPENLRELASQVDADASGKLTVLYSGPTTKEVRSSDVIKAMNASGEDVRVIDNSQAAKFLQSEDFYHAVAETYGIPEILPLSNGTYRGPATDWLYDAQQGPWADVSARFVDATRGEVRVIASDARPDRVFGAVELPHALANPNITTIEDVPRDVLAARQASHGTQAAFEMVVARARDNVGRLNVAVNYAGTPLREHGALQMDSRAYCVGTCIQGRTPGFTSVTQPLADRMGPPSPYVTTGQQHWHAWQAEVAQAGRDATVAKLVRGAGVLGGTAAIAYDAGNTAVHASDLFHQHNNIGAASEIEHFASRNIAGFGLAAFGAEIGSAGGPVGSVTGGVVGGGIGIFGGDKLMDAYDNHKIYGQTDPHGTSWQYDPARPQHGWTRTVADGFAERGLSHTRIETAPPALADRLTFQANTTAVELALAHRAQPRDPYTQPASASDTPLPGNPPWTRDPQTPQWSRLYVDAFAERGLSQHTRVLASPERAAQLDTAAVQLIADNLAHAPRGIAEHYQALYAQRDWQQYGPMPKAVTAALKPPANSLQASDGHTYTREKDGSWHTPGRLWGSNAAEGTVHRELDAPYRQEPATNTTRGGPGSATPVLRLDDPGHSGHALFKQAQAHVNSLDAQRGRTPDAQSRNLAGVAVVAAQAHGLTRIDDLLPNTRDGSTMFICQHTSPLKRIAEIPTVQAINTPLEQSSAQYLHVARQQAQEQVQQRMQVQSQDIIATPAQSAPQMKM